MRRKVAMIAHAFPPCHAIGALRAAKFAKYLPKYGWEPIVITRTWPQQSWGMDEPPGVRVVRTAYHDRLGIFRRSRSSQVRTLSESSQSPGWRSKVRKLASFWVRELIAYPDEFIGWKRYAVEAARELLKGENVAIIFSSSPPPTAHLIAREVQRETRLPWVADFRDLWIQNHYLRHTALRRYIERRLEKRTLARASVLVTVSSPLAAKLGRLHNKPVEVITNGFDEDDYSGPPPSPTPYFSLTYTGQIYAGKRDPSLLFSAVRKLLQAGVIDSLRFRIRFYGPDGSFVEKLAARFRVAEVVSYEGLVPYAEAVRHQRGSTALLLLSWHAPEEKGIYTGKVFEYLGARRPILVIPRTEGVLDELMEETGAGVAASSEEELIMLLVKWYDEFLTTGSLKYRGKEEAISKYTREQQARKLAQVFDRVLEGRL